MSEVIGFIKSGENIKYCNTDVYYPFPELDGYLVAGNFEKENKKYFLAILPKEQVDI